MKKIILMKNEDGNHYNVLSTKRKNIILMQIEMEYEALRPPLLCPGLAPNKYSINQSTLLIYTKRNTCIETLN